MRRFPYNPERVAENKAGQEPITEKQINYINSLAYKRDLDFLFDVLKSIPNYKNPISTLSKGQGMFVIKCLLDEIEPL